jgi:hypothetical protein
VIRRTKKVLDWLRFIDSDEVNSMEAIAEKNESVRRAVPAKNERGYDDKVDCREVVVVTSFPLVIARNATWSRSRHCAGLAVDLIF